MKLMLVDDEALLLSALRRVLLCRFDDIDVRTFADAASALCALDEEPGAYDLLVTDMRMPGMDGAQLLEAVEKKSPDVVRIVLSGQMDETSRQRASQHAHDILTKPCPNDVLSDAVRRAGELRSLLNDPIVKGAAGALLCGSGPPPAFGALVKKLDRRTCVEDVAVLVDEDAALARRVRALACTAPFDGGLGAAAAADTAAAVRRIGVLALKAIVLFSSLQATVASSSSRAHSVDLDELARAAEARALAAACVAARNDNGDRDVGARYAGALLADVGRLVTCGTFPAAVDAVADAVANGTDVDDAERAFLGATHREIGAYLLGVFCMPLPVIEAVRKPSPRARPTTAEART
jgi:DNA-binding NarL/FixJ family response regulator